MYSFQWVLYAVAVMPSEELELKWDLLDLFRPQRFVLEIFIEFATDESYDCCYILVFVEFCPG